MGLDDLIPEIQERYRQSGGILNERERRLWAAEEAMKLGRGGIATISKALRISPNTIKKGMLELATEQPDTLPAAVVRVRKTGGGRKPKQKSLDPPKTP